MSAWGQSLRIAAAARCILFSNLGTSIGDVASGLLSQLLHSRRRAILLSLGLVVFTVSAFLNARAVSPATLYALCFALGVSTGYWAVLVTTAAEHFGTNLRATVSTTIPNVVRASVIPLNLAFAQLSPRWGLLPAERTKFRHQSCRLTVGPAACSSLPPKNAPPPGC